MQMTPDHIADIDEARDEAETEAGDAETWLAEFTPSSKSAKKYAARAHAARCRAARLAEVAAYLQSQGWQGMETAPKDGTVVLGFVPGYGGGECLQVACYGGEWAWDNGMSGETNWTPKPTHWMPLPAAPTQQGDE